MRPTLSPVHRRPMQDPAAERRRCQDASRTIFLASYLTLQRCDQRPVRAAGRPGHRLLFLDFPLAKNRQFCSVPPVSHEHLTMLPDQQVTNMRNDN